MIAFTLALLLSIGACVVIDTYEFGFLRFMLEPIERRKNQEPSRQATDPGTRSWTSVPEPGELEIVSLPLIRAAWSRIRLRPEERDCG
jgi:hypothetical protein